MDKHSVLIVGCGSIGERHLRCFQQTGRAAVYACDADPALAKRMAQTYGANFVPHWEAALEAGCGAMVICTPAHLHVPMALQALKAGRHVLIEKPLAQSLDGVGQLLAEVKTSGCQSAVAYVFRVYPFLEQARALIRGGELGPVRQAWCSSGQPFHRLRPAYARTYYRDRRTGGGAIQDALTHTVNWVESILGPADSLLCDCAHLALPDVDVEDTVHLAARHGPVLVSYALNQFQAPNESVIQFNLAHGSVRVEFHRQRWGVFGEDASDWVWREAPFPAHDSHFIAQAHAFLDQIEGRPPRLCSVEDACHTLRSNLAALASAASGARVDCRDFHV